MLWRRLSICADAAATGGRSVPAVVSQPNCVAKGVARSGASIVIAPAVDMLGRGAESLV